MLSQSPGGTLLFQALVGGSGKDPGNSRESFIVVEDVEMNGTRRLKAMAIYQQIRKYSVI